MNNRATKLLIITLMLVLPFFILPGVKAEVKAQTGWKKMRIKVLGETKIKNILLQGISGVNKNDIFAVGRDEKTNTGIILHYDGDGDNNGKHDDIWEEIPPNEQPKNLNAVCIGADNDFFAVGDGGTVFFGEGKKWKRILQQEIYGNLKGVWVSAENTIFAVGDKGTVITGADGGKDWSHKKVVDKKLNAVWGSSENNIFAVGDGGTVLYYDGKVWIEILQEELYGNLKGIWVSAENTIFAVGDKGIITRTDGVKNWSLQKVVDKKRNEVVLDKKLNGIWGTAPNNIFAVGDGGTVIHYDGKEWSEMKKPINDNLYAVWQSQNPHIFVVGPGSIIKQAFPAIFGRVCNACSDGVGIEDAGIHRWDIHATPAADWYLMGDARTDPTGSFNYTQWKWRLPSAEAHRFKFSHPAYDEEVTEPDFYVPGDHWLEVFSHLIPNQNYARCVSGVVSEVKTVDGIDLYYYVDGITVELHIAAGCGWAPVRTATTSNGGHYYFDLTTDPNARYRVFVPDAAPCTFAPEHEFLIPHGETTIMSYDMIKTCP